MDINEAYVKYKELFDFAEINVKLEDIVDVEELMKTPAAPSLETGLAYAGSILYHTALVYKFAKELLPIYKHIAPINTKSLVKVIVLHQLGKVGMFTPNTDNWQVQKLGKVYTFVETGSCLKTGERSKLVCGNAGVTFTAEEYEAMSILDKTGEEYENMTKFRTPLSTILKNASDLAYARARKLYNDELNNNA